MLGPFIIISLLYWVYPSSLLLFIGFGIENANILGHLLALYTGIIIGAFLLSYYYKDLRFKEKIKKPPRREIFSRES